jgi:endonuclease/exonuclease/phosphatase (EEP) superfamily protein YafD
MLKSLLRRRLRIVALLLLYSSVAAIAVSTIVAEFGETWWIADLFAHFRYHYALGALLLAAVAVTLGRRGVGVAAVCLIVPQIWAVAAPPRTPIATEANASPDMRVMSMNVLYSNRRFDDVVHAVEREAPDILSMQEVTQRWHPVIERLAARLPYIAPADWRTQSSDNVLLSRFPIVEGQLIAPPNQHRPFAHVDATIMRNGRSLRVLAVHPPLPSGPRNTATRQANFDYYAGVAATTEAPLLIVGDFNITPYSPRFRALLRDGGLRYVHLGWTWPASWPSESRGDFQRYIRGFPIDHILTSRHFAVSAARAIKDVGSDHYPVVADLVLLR